MGRLRIRFPLILIVLYKPLPALAGMPAPYVLRDIARMRIEAISFFLLIILLAAWAVQGIWNGVRGSIPRLPRLNYPRALGLVILSGLLFSTVLAMISGARELMTPGAWEREPNRPTYRLKATTQP